MKKIPWGRTDTRRRAAWWGRALLGVALLVVLVRLALPNVFLSVVAPAFWLGDALAAHTDAFFTNFADTRALATKVRTLGEENTALAIENRTLTEKVYDLTALLGTSSPGPRGVLAGVVARPPVAAYDTLILAEGSGAGVAPGMVAYGAGGLPLGIISSVTAGFARVTLFSTPGMETPAWVGSEHLPATLRGAGAGAFAVSVPRNSHVAVGDTVFVAGPGALPIGTVVRVGGESSDPVAALYVQPVANPFSITWVVLKDVGSGVFTATSTP